MSSFAANPLPWVLPPFLGAIIGYVTNALAVRMLFRPLTEKRLLGLRIPLTPGIFPKQRYALAVSIGRMVSEQLINAETLQKQLAAESFQDGVKRNVSLVSAKLLSTPMSRLSREQWSVFYDSLDSYLAGTIHRFVSSESFQTTVRGLLREIIHSVSRKTLEQVINREKLFRFLEEKVFPKVLENGKLKGWLLGKLEDWLNAKLRQNARLDTLLPDELLSGVVSAFRSLLPNLLESLFVYLRSDAMRKDIEHRGRFLLRDILDKLTNFQRFFISVAQYDRTLDEKMPEIVEEALDYFQEAAFDEDNQEKMVQAVENSLKKWSKGGLADTVYAAGFDITATARSAGDKIFTKLKDQGGSSKLIEFLDGIIERNASRTISDVLQNQVGLAEDDLIDTISEPLTRYLSRRESSDVIAKRIIHMAEQYLQQNPEATVGELLALDQEKKDRIDTFATAKLVDIMNERLPALIETFDIRQLVEDKINSLDVAQVEKLLLMVIAKHLKWINVFGALLGAIIGLTQVLLNLFRAL